ncbi:MAG: TIGR03067 domain-containing protein [Puniceicoccales bacterium]|jgi:uncharacterized protein (TIGR03067 family)|nr:TIGR03067 domain-containing protein [Puniceicoccales bacterium]
MIRTLLAFFTLAFAVGCSTEAPPPPEPTLAEKDTAALQGSWKISSIDETAFRLTMFEFDRASKMTLAFSGNQFAMAIGDRQAETGTYTIDTAKTPKEIVLASSNKQPAQKFIYKFENGALVLCGAEPGKSLLTQFKSDRETRALALTFNKTSAPAATAQ